MTYCRTLLLLLAWFPLVTLTCGAVELEFRDAALLVEHTPKFLQYQARGYCPQSADGGTDGRTASFVIRAECKSLSWIASYQVDLATGAITNAGTGATIETEQLATLRQQLLARRASTRLTKIEAACLIEEFLRTYDKQQGRSSCPIETVTAEDDRFFVAKIENECKSPSQVIKGPLRIDRYTGDIYDVQTGTVRKSPESERIKKNILEAHSEARLTTDEAKFLVENLKPVLSNKKSSCTRVSVESGHNADDAWFQIWPDCDDTAVTRVSVNLLTGALRDISTLAVYDSPPLRIQRQKLLAAARARVVEASEAARLSCEIVSSGKFGKK